MRLNLTTCPLDLSRQSQHGFQLRPNFGIRQPGSISFGDDDDIVRGQNSLMEPEKFPQEAFNPIPLYGFPQFFGRDHSQTGPMQVIGSQRNNEMCGVPILARKFDPLKVCTLQQPIGFGKSGLALRNCCPLPAEVAGEWLCRPGLRPS